MTYPNHDHSTTTPAGETSDEPDAAHRRGPRHLRRDHRGRHAAAGRRRTALYSAGAAIAAAAIGSVIVSMSSASPPEPVIRADTVTVGEADRSAAAEDRAARSERRAADPPSPQASSAGAQPKASATQAPTTAAPKAAVPKTTSAAPTPAASKPTVHAPVGGLTQAEMNNAVAIIEAGQQMKLPSRAFVVAIATALQESHLQVLANPNVPASLKLPNEGVGTDHDSVGLFQQRPSWGPVAQLMDPHQSARLFYAALVKVNGWEQMAVTVAAQTVQVSAYPDAYAKWQSLAEQVVNAVV
ncbi:hypothetical protein KZZ52_44585 [Dactylosporangium sp. AC04546]|uniref:hypothetical protein n=1 Tax=Dactylosporangium sp. AC04546 TaxID=2862460 RepID=UPI001EDF97BD|nr:hypothetical protein [Dactylosporangium sp. AC04546]WVK80994.1 hypothetical protein KZZ52_44585 [Dactylosporangium sp. AC04546]